AFVSFRDEGNQLLLEAIPDLDGSLPLTPLANHAAHVFVVAYDLENNESAPVEISRSSTALPTVSRALAAFVDNPSGTPDTISGAAASVTAAPGHHVVAVRVLDAPTAANELAVVTPDGTGAFPSTPCGDTAEMTVFLEAVDDAGGVSPRVSVASV